MCKKEEKIIEEDNKDIEINHPSIPDYENFPVTYATEEEGKELDSFWKD